MDRQRRDPRPGCLTGPVVLLGQQRGPRAQLIQAEPLGPSGEITTVQIAEGLDANGHLAYYATVRNDGAQTADFRWRGGGF